VPRAGNGKPCTVQYSCGCLGCSWPATSLRVLCQPSRVSTFQARFPPFFLTTAVAVPNAWPPPPPPPPLSPSPQRAALGFPLEGTRRALCQPGGQPGGAAAGAAARPPAAPAGRHVRRGRRVRAAAGGGAGGAARPAQLRAAQRARVQGGCWPTGRQLGAGRESERWMLAKGGTWGAGGLVPFRLS
jgi:hypothetical protein